MRLRLLGRRSDLAVLQTGLVAQALTHRWPSVEIVQQTRSSIGDRDRHLDLSAASDRGVFTTDLSQALDAGEADAVVHSWKDLPTAELPGTRVAATLTRADPRDVLLVRRDVFAARPPILHILSSSPRRAWQLETSLRALMPWPVEHLSVLPVRGNVPTRLAKLLAREGDALVVAKAAIDRLLAPDAPGVPSATAEAIRSAIDTCRWMVLPLQEFPTAPAQGAIAVEIATHAPAVSECIRAINDEPTWRAARAERDILTSLGGGCHEAIGATVLIRDYGTITSVRARMPGMGDRSTWTLSTDLPTPPMTSVSMVWPRPDERHLARRHTLAVPLPSDSGLWIARADALPDSERPSLDQVVWVAGVRTWHRLAARGIWVHGCADGLGDVEKPGVDLLAGKTIGWRRLTHTKSSDPDAVPTYVVENDLPDDIGMRTHFFWTSGSQFREALAREPGLRSAWHASGPGRTARAIRETLTSHERVSIWLDYDQWQKEVTA